MLPNYFDYTFVQLKQKVRLWPELSTKFLSTLGPNPNPNRKAQLDLQLWCAQINRLQLFARIFDVLSQMGEDDRLPISPPPTAMAIRCKTMEKHHVH